MKRPFLLFVLLALASLALPASAELPGPSSAVFAKGVKLSVAGYTNANGTARSALANFPVLVRVSEAGIDGFDYDDVVSRLTGADVAFVGMDGMPLPFEIDEWHADGTSLVWVTLPVLTNGAEFVMCWGSATSGKTVCADNPWIGYAGVWHMAEASGNVADSAGHSLDAVPTGADAATLSVAVSGAIGNGRQCSDSASHRSYLAVPTYNSLGVGDTFAVSGWLNVPVASGDARVFSRKVYYTNAGGWEVVWKNNKEFSARGNQNATLAKYTSEYGEGWKHFFIVYDNKSTTIYENGVWKAQNTTGNVATDNDRPLGIGDYASDNKSSLVGSVDECRLLDAVPPADWAWAEYAGIADSGFLVAGTAEDYEGSDDPVAGVSVSGIAYTNATVTANVASFGTGANSADVLVQLAATSAFADPLWSTNYAVSASGSESFAVTCLDWGSNYWVRILVTNALGVAVEPAPVSFSTPVPGTPAVSLQAGTAAFSTLSGTAIATAIGTGGERVAVWLDVSAAGDFTDAVSFGGSTTDAVPASVSIMATGLDDATTYAVRARAVNVWGLSAVSATATMTTRTEPVEMSAPGALYAGNGVETLSISAIDVEPGTTYSVSLAVDGAATGSWTGLSAVDDFSADWSGAEDTAHVAVFTVDSSLGGRSWTREVRMPFTVGATASSISGVAALDSMILRVGDSVTLPALAANESLAYDTNAVVSANGTAFTALEPGACRIRIFATDSVSGETALSQSGVMIVLPKAADCKGGVFVNRTAVSGTKKWCNASSWQKVSGAEGHDWPDGTDDIALVYLPLEGYTVTFDLENHDIVLGYLGAGSTHNDKILYFSKGGITFRTSDGSESWLRFSGRTGGNGELSFASTVPVTLANDLVLDGLEQNAMKAVFNGAVNIGDHTLRTARVPHFGGGDPYPRGHLQLIGNVSGAGLFLHEADAMMRANGTKSFTGTWDIRNGRHTGNYGGCGMFLGGGHLAGARELAVRGAWMSDKDVRHGASVQTGWGNSYQYTASTNYFVGVLPPKVTLDGGRLSLTTEGPFPKTQVTNYVNSGVRDDWYVTGEFRIAGGPMGHVNSGFVSNFNDYYPNAHTIITNMVVEPGGSSSFSLSTTKTFGTFPASTNEFFVLNAPAAAWDSGRGYEILPFFYPNCENANFNVAIRDTATGRVSLSNAVHSLNQTGTIRRFEYDNKNKDYTETMPEDASYQAVLMALNRKAAFPAEGSVATIESGFLGLRGGTQFGRTNDLNSASSTLDFGNRTGYVYVNYQSETADIGCRVAGTAGFVKSAGGTLQLHQPLADLSGGVRVGAGRLSLLDSATLGPNDVFVAAGAKLRIAGADPFDKDARLDLEDREWISTTSKIELDNAEEARVRRLYVNGENWRRGTYGSSGSAAQFVDDAFFSGSGILKVKGDDLVQPTLVILR